MGLGAIDEFLGFLQTETGRAADSLDDGNLVATSSGENDVEFGLLFSTAAFIAATTSTGHHDRAPPAAGSMP